MSPLPIERDARTHGLASLPLDSRLMSENPAPSDAKNVGMCRKPAGVAAGVSELSRGGFSRGSARERASAPKTERSTWTSQRRRTRNTHRHRFTQACTQGQSRSNWLEVVVRAGAHGLFALSRGVCQRHPAAHDVCGAGLHPLDGFGARVPVRHDALRVRGGEVRGKGMSCAGGAVLTATRRQPGAARGASQPSCSAGTAGAPARQARALAPRRKSVRDLRSLCSRRCSST